MPYDKYRGNEGIFIGFTDKILYKLCTCIRNRTCFYIIHPNIMKIHSKNKLHANFNLEHSNYILILNI